MQEHLPPVLFLLHSCGFWDFQQSIPSLLGRMDDSFFILSLLGVGMSPCPAEDSGALGSTRQAPLSLLGKRESAGGGMSEVTKK